MEDIARKKPTFALHAQVINAVSPGKLYLRAGRLDEATDKMREVVIYDLGDPARRRTIFADSGTMALTPSGDLALTLFDGSMEEVQKTNPGELQRLYYIENHIRVHGVGNTLTRSTNDTYKSEREMSVCEMQDVAAEAERDQAAIASEIEHSLVNGVRIAATGTSGPAPLPPGAHGWTPVPRQMESGPRVLRLHGVGVPPAQHPAGGGGDGRGGGAGCRREQRLERRGESVARRAVRTVVRPDPAPASSAAPGKPPVTTAQHPAPSARPLPPSAGAGGSDPAHRSFSGASTNAGPGACSSARDCPTPAAARASAGANSADHAERGRGDAHQLSASLEAARARVDGGHRTSTPTTSRSRRSSRSRSRAPSSSCSAPRSRFGFRAAASGW